MFISISELKRILKDLIKVLEIDAKNLKGEESLIKGKLKTCVEA